NRFGQNLINRSKFRIAQAPKLQSKNRLAQYCGGCNSLSEKLFKSDCVSCHKANGSGGVKLGNATSADLREPDLEDAYKTDEAIAAAILDGKDEEGKDLEKVMPHWRGKLSDAQVTDLIAYLKTLKK